MPWACTPNEGSCEGAKAYTCSGDGLQKTLVVDCGAAGKDCMAGSCVAKLCGNGVVEIGEQCDDGNTAGKDGCTAGCLYEGGKFVGYAEYPYLRCDWYGVAEQDAKAHLYCSNKFPGSFAASVAAITFKLVVGLPIKNYASVVVPTCPECLSSEPKPQCKSGKNRRMQKDGLAWPESLEDWPSMYQQQTDGGYYPYQAVCILP
jgi:cysteine-rich repeat protein